MRRFGIVLICGLAFLSALYLERDGSSVKIDVGKDIVCGVDMEEMEIDDYLDMVDKITIYINGKKKTYLISDNEFRLMISEMEYLLSDCHDMPAFGVSLHEETIHALKSGYWVEFSFPNTMEHNEMPFDAWLIEVEKDFSGFNIIRKWSGKYEGRCYYMRLMNGKTLDGLYGILDGIEKLCD